MKRAAPSISRWLGLFTALVGGLAVTAAGAATLWVLGNVMNSPSEGKERPAANALVLVEKRPRHE